MKGVIKLLYPILGILGGLLCAVGDCLLDIKGKDNRTLGVGNMVNSNWVTMKTWRFQVSFMLGFLAVPCVMLGSVFLGELMAESDEKLGKLFQNTMMIGCIGGFFIHSILCIIPIFYQELRKIADEEKSCQVLKLIWDTIAIPFLVLYSILIFVSSLLLITGICKDVLAVPRWFVVLNPMVFMIISIILRKIFPKHCQEVPGVFMPSLGLAMYGVISLVHVSSF